MKNIFYSLLIIFLSNIIHAQDIVVKLNNDEIKTKIIEITDETIKYKEFDFQDGPIRNIKISEVFMVLYENGKREKFTALESQASIENINPVIVSQKKITSKEVGNASFSERMKVLEGDFKNLKEIKNYDVVFDYTGVMIPKFDSEEDFLVDKMSKREEKEVGAGEVFKNSWFNDRENKYQPEFIDSFNKDARKKGITVSENSGAKYIINIQTLIIYPGYNVGVSSSRSAIKVELSIYDKHNPDVLLIKVLYGKSSGDTAYNAGDRIADCYDTLAALLYSDIKKRAFK